MDRRMFLASTAAVLTPASALTQTKPASLREAAMRMALYGLPLIEMATTRERAMGAGQTVNVFRHARALLTPKTQTVTQPNNDTLYSSAWLDLSRGPVRITLPKTGERYFSLALMDMFTNNFSVVGTRTVGGAGGEVLLVGPAESLPAKGAIRSPTNWVWALGRTLVDGPADLGDAHSVQDALGLDGAKGGAARRYAKRNDPWPAWFDGLQGLVLENPPPATDLRVFRDAAALGITPAGDFDAARFTRGQGVEIAAGLADALAIAKMGGASGQKRGAWSFPRQNLGDFRQDYLYRAQVAVTGLAALPLDEACYLRALGPDGSDNLDSRKNWRLRFPAGQAPPVDAFWSLTAYEATPDGQGFLFENPISRYAIGDRTPGLTHNADGSLDIWISPADPGPQRRANWLPSPTSGKPLTLSLRAYLPRPELMTGAWQPPPVTLVGARSGLAG